MNQGAERIFEQSREGGDDAGKYGAFAHDSPLSNVAGDVVFASTAGSLDNASGQAPRAGAEHSADAALRGKAVDDDDGELARVGFGLLKANNLLNSPQQ